MTAGTGWHSLAVEEIVLTLSLNTDPEIDRLQIKARRPMSAWRNERAGPLPKM